jgi:hypothetical protein
VQEVLFTIHRVRHICDRLRPFYPWLEAIRALALDRPVAHARLRRGGGDLERRSLCNLWRPFANRQEARRDAKAALGRAIEWRWTYFCLSC